MLGYHRKSAIRVLGRPAVVRGPRIVTGRPRSYEPGLLLPWLRPIWQATDYACGRRLVAMLPEWIPAYEQHERRLPGEVREIRRGPVVTMYEFAPENLTILDRRVLYQVEVPDWAAARGAGEESGSTCRCGRSPDP